MNKIGLASVLSASVLLAACGSDSDSEGVVGASYGFKSSGGSDGSEAEYLVTQENIMEGTLSAQGTGYEQLSWNFFYNVGNTLFVTGYTNFTTQSYAVDENNEVSELATFLFDKALVMFGSIGDETLLATDSPSPGHGTRLLYTVDAATGFATKKVNYTIHDVDTGVPGQGTMGWATALVVRDDHLFVPFHKLDDLGYYTTPDADTAYVAVYDYPLEDNAEPLKIISDTRTSHIGVNGMTTSLITADNGDMYSFSNGTVSGGFNPASTKPSGILKIASGETEFDADYFFNIKEATNGGTIFWFDYVSNNKAIARILVNEDECNAVTPTEDTPSPCSWAAYGRDFYNQKLVVIDLVNQTVTDIAGVPLHAKRYTSPIDIIDGKIYVSIETAEDAYVYQVDIETATAVKGAKIEGKTIKGFFDLYN